MIFNDFNVFFLIYQGTQRIAFHPYTFDEIEKIIAHRVLTTGAPMANKQVIELAARKV
jgi:Cdc6-like AAA superfamily ATPase